MNAKGAFAMLPVRGGNCLTCTCWDQVIWGPSTALPFASRTATSLRMTGL